MQWEGVMIKVNRMLIDAMIRGADDRARTTHEGRAVYFFFAGSAALSFFVPRA